jgi:hypothetical protein
MQQWFRLTHDWKIRVACAEAEARYGIIRIDTRMRRECDGVRSGRAHGIYWRPEVQLRGGFLARA